jgi:hypothetical protein
MARNKRNYNQDHFKVGGSAQPGGQEVPDREKQKLATQKEKQGRGKHARVEPPPVGDGPDA